ncbi:MAG: hypothetical protein ACYDAR_15725 [Thermomicrobiales bacterium]
MAERRNVVHPSEQSEGRRAIGRRGLIAGAAAVVVGALAKRAAEPVAAAPINGGTNGQALVIGANPVSGTSNTATYTTTLIASVPDFAGLYFRNDSTPSSSTETARGLFGYTIGSGTNNYGVMGQSNSGIAVYGYASDPTGIGLYGEAGAGVYGIYGLSDKAGGVGVSGNCTGGYGVLGTVSDGYGVLGQAVTGNGVNGFSQQKHGIVGQTTGAGFGGVFGIATTPGTVGIYGSTVSGGANVGTAYAGYFDGNLVAVHGAKSAAVPLRGGGYGLVYCMESPEAWFEDFGTGKVVNGKAEIALDTDFAAIVHADAYHVFLTAHGNYHLHLEKQAPTGFTVRVTTGAGAAPSATTTVSGTFSYRIVARRKDIAAERLAKFNLPMLKAAHDAPPKPPSPPPAPPKPPRQG